MAQFDVYRNPSSTSRARVPYLLDVQSDLLDLLSTRVVVPLCRPGVLKGRLADRLNPVFAVEGKEVTMLTPELAGVPEKALGEPVGNVSAHRGAIVAALDLLITGF